MKGFREFILRGNVMDLAVAVVVGAAFTAIVTALVTDVIDPIVGVLFNANDLSTALVVTVPAIAGGKAGHLQFGAFLAAVINFILIAAVVYFVFVLPVNAFLKRAFQRQQQQPASSEPAPPTELDLLVQIRDLLKDRPVADDARTLRVD